MTSAVALGSARTILHAIEHLFVIDVVVVVAVVAVVAVVVVIVAVTADAEAIKVFHFPLKDHF